MGGDFGPEGESESGDMTEVHISDSNLEEALDEICEILENGGDVNITWNPEQ